MKNKAKILKKGKFNILEPAQLSKVKGGFPIPTEGKISPPDISKI